MSVEIIIGLYFFASACVASWVAMEWEDRQLSRSALLVFFGPVFAFCTPFVNAWEWLESHAQAKTFWFYLFNRSRMLRTTEELEQMHEFTLRRKATGSIEHRLWRVAERLYFRVNNYTPAT